MLQAARIMYVGPGLAGGSTSLESVLRSTGSASTNHVRGQECSFAIDAAGCSWQVSARVSVYRAWLWYDDPLDPSLDSRVVAEIDLLPRCDGFIFVVDARQERAEGSEEAVEILTRDLSSRGADLQEFPIVFQANRLDAPGAHSIDWVQEHFRARHAKYVESNALAGVGTVEAMKRLLTMIGEGRS